MLVTEYAFMVQRNSWQQLWGNTAIAPSSYWKMEKAGGRGEGQPTACPPHWRGGDPHWCREMVKPNRMRYWIPGRLSLRSTTWGSENSRKFFSEARRHSKVWAGLASPEAVMEKVSHASFLGPGGWLAILGVSWLGAAPLQSLPLASLCVSTPKSPSFYKDPRHWTRTHPDPVWAHLNLMASAWLCFNIRPDSWVPGVRTWTYLLRGHNSTHSTYLKSWV